MVVIERKKTLDRSESPPAKFSEMAAALEFNARLMVDFPERVVVKEFESDNCVVIELTVRDCDIGKIIGKAGKNAEALRTIIYGIASKHKKRVVVQINQ